MPLAMASWRLAMSCETFPFDAQEELSFKSNPAIQRFGNRLYIDQTSIEFLSELLLIAVSEKKVGQTIISGILPSYSVLKNWEQAQLEYAPKARLNLKLFSFLGASRLGSRHISHRDHYADLLQELKPNIITEDSNRKEEIIRTLENLFVGFQGAGRGRTWCAQSFIPISKGFLSGETIWNETEAKKNPPENWTSILERISTYLTMNKHRFLARGGEVLYLQICNGLRQTGETIRQWVEQNGLSLHTHEQNPEWLRNELDLELHNLMNRCPSTLTDIAEFIDQGIESNTSRVTDQSKGDHRWVSAGWCANESWQEGYLFAIELLRLCKADLDMIDRLNLLETACSMQVLRTLALQSARYISSEYSIEWPNYRMAVSDSDEKRPVIKKISQNTVKTMEKQIFQSIRRNGVILPQGEKQPDRSLNEADKHYAGKLFIGLAKRIGFIVPRRGRGARFVLNERLLRFLVITTVPVGGRLTFDTFKRIVERHHGIVFDAQGFSRANKWTEGKEIFLNSDTDSWLQNMLDASGMLIHLSDSCALVENPSGLRN